MLDFWFIMIAPIALVVFAGWVYISYALYDRKLQKQHKIELAESDFETQYRDD